MLKKDLIKEAQKHCDSSFISVIIIDFIKTI